MDIYNYQNNTQPPQKPPNIFRSFLYAFIPTKYDQLIKVKTGSLIGFVILLTLLGALVEMTAFGIRFMGEMNEEIPNIVIRDGRLYTDGDYLATTQITYLYVTDDVDEFSYEDTKALVDSGYRQIMLIGRDKISVLRYQEYQELYFADVVGYGEEIAIKDLEKVLLCIAVAIMSMIFYVGSAIWYFLSSAILLVIGLILAQLFGRRLNAGQIFRIAVYSRVLGYAAATLVNAFSFLSFSVPTFIRIAITLIFMTAVFYFIPREDVAASQSL